MVLLFSILVLFILHLVGIGFDFIMIVPLLLSCCGFYFVFGHEVSFFRRFQCHPVDGYSTASCDLVLLQEKISPCSFYSASLKVEF